MSELALMMPLQMKETVAGVPVRFAAMWHVPVPLKVRVPLAGVSLRSVRGLKVGDVLVTEAVASDEVALYAANVALSFGEFEVVDGTIGIRLTRLGQR